jgi:hypothetical protein
MQFNGLKKLDFSLNKTEKNIRRKRREGIFVDRAEKIIIDALEKFFSQENVKYNALELRRESRALAKTLAERFKKYSDADISGLDVQTESAFFDALLEKVNSAS